ncbi:helix-turn-helix transcriptional regulator [Clostridium sp. C8-1-8]|uniref:PadR family transcriptional regulator n=1 Tax=Clostridium sp. C8-1-8 TaxID=2698831 RepID=UPI00136FFA3D|nr:helix-turn-helix transcriptional regulator [Clostridium sp. C8-1-8]
MRKNAKEFLPLTETSFFILAALWEPLHGYGIMQTVDKVTNSRVMLLPGTLYGALSKLTKDGLIEVFETAEDVERRKNYRLTSLGREVVRLEFKRIETLGREAKDILGGVDLEGN